MKGFVLAAGYGTRLHPITDTTPKALLPVGNLPLVGYALRLLAHHGITDVIVNLHHLAKPIRDTLGDGAAFGVRLTYSEEDEILGTGGGLKKMHDSLADGTFVVVNADTVADVDLEAVIAAHREQGALATMVLRRDPAQAHYGQIEIDAEGRIRKLLGETDGSDHGDVLTPYMFAGVHVMEPRILEYIPPDVNTCVNRYVYTKALRNGEPLHGVVMDGCWADAGTPARYLALNHDVLARRVKLRHAEPLAGYALAPKRDVAEVVCMGNDVDLGTGAHILPPVLLGEGTRVGDHATVGPGSIIGPRVQVGKQARVSQSVVLEGARIEPNARIHRMIVGKKASIKVDDEPL